MIPCTFLFDDDLPREKRKLIQVTLGSRLARFARLSSTGYELSPVDQKLVTHLSDGFDLDPANDDEQEKDDENPS